MFIFLPIHRAINRNSDARNVLYEGELAIKRCRKIYHNKPNINVLQLRLNTY